MLKINTPRTSTSGDAYAFMVDMNKIAKRNNSLPKQFTERLAKCKPRPFVSA